MLKQQELLKIKGGTNGYVIIGIVGAALAFLVGVFDGFTRPFNCR